MMMLLPTDLNFCKVGESFNSDATVSVGLSCYAMSNSLLGWTNKASWSELTCNDINSATKTEVKEHGSVETSHLKDIMAHNAYLGGCCGNGSVTNAMCVSTELHDCAFKLASKAGNPCKSDACNRDAESEECARVVLDYCGGEGSNDPGCASAVSNTTNGHNATEAAIEAAIAAAQGSPNPSPNLYPYFSTPRCLPVAYPSRDSHNPSYSHNPSPIYTPTSPFLPVPSGGAGLTCKHATAHGVVMCHTISEMSLVHVPWPALTSAIPIP